nr:diguanylate cyclase [uncultured Cohaesibacter sp.]
MEHGGMFDRIVSKFRSLSLRSWLTVGMCVVLLPFAITSCYGYKIYHEEISKTFRNVINAQHRVLMPLERIEDEFWAISAEVNDYSQDGLAEHKIAFEASVKEVEAHLLQMKAAVEDNGRYEYILHSVQAHWERVLNAAPAVIKGSSAKADPELLIFENEISQTAQQLGHIAEGLRVESEEAHRTTLDAIKRLEVIAILAGIFAIGFAVAAIYAIDRVLISSTDKLVEGAMRVASGERHQEIDVQVPPELASVAKAFNTMTRQIVVQEAMLESAARFDGLTSLKNRREFDIRIAEQIRKAKGQPALFALLMIDVDHFKCFNDTHGHLAGDDALRHLAKILVKAARNTDEIFRYGGEEFVVLLPEIQPSQILPVAERIRKEVEASEVLLPNGQLGSITISIGAAKYAEGLTFNDIVGQADAALYEAKASGRNRVVLAS